MIKKRKRRTAAEILAEWESDPVWRAEQEAADKEIEERAAKFTAEERPLVKDLRKAGFKVKSVEDITSMYGGGLPWEQLPATQSYSNVLPILMEHLKRPYSADVRSAIAQAMNSAEALPYWAQLKQLLYKEKDDFTQQLLINVLAAIATTHKEFLSQIIEMIRDKKLGRPRSLFVSVLTRYARRVPEAERALQELKNDPDLRVEIGRRLHEREVRQRRQARKGTPKR